MSFSLSSELRGQLEPSRRRLAAALESRSVAIAQEWIGARAGSEKVFEALADLLPDAELFALTKEPGCELDTGGRDIRTTILDRSWFRAHRAVTLPLMPLAWRLATRHHYDVAVTSSHAFAREFGRHGDQHLSYVHSPARYLWFPELDARTDVTRGERLQRPARDALKRLDLKSTERTGALAANSQTTQARIREVYERDARVIHPPVDTSFYQLASVERTGSLLAFGRLIPYKRFDAAIEVAAELRRPLVIAGTGPDENRLRRLAESTPYADVAFVGSVTDQEIRELYRASAALLFFGVEDFGIIPVEAQACGLPVVASGTGGTLETVLDSVSGAHATGASHEHFVAATHRALNSGIDPEACRSHALTFSYAEFGRNIADWLTDTIV